MTARMWTVGVATLAAGLLLAPAAVQAQGAGGGVGIGPRITFVRGTAEAPDGSQRFSGGMIRLGSGKSVLELAMDYRAGLTGDLTERIKDYPIQASLLLFPVRGRFAPYLLGGVGWYSQHVQRLGPTQSVLEDETTRKMGYHAGFGGEARLHRHLGLYGDYRYTFIRFGDDELTTPTADQRPSGPTPLLPTWVPFADRLRMSHEGSMFTWGAAFYF